MSKAPEAPPRLAPGRALPTYAYRRGRTPHPTRDAAGHGGIDPGDNAASTEDGAWESFLYGFDLFNRGYYWEAHEAWEDLWHSHGRNSQDGRLIKGLIALAAAGLKLHEGNPNGAVHHARRAERLFAALAAETGEIMGLYPDALASLAKEIVARPPDQPNEDPAARQPMAVVAPLLPRRVR